MLCDMLHTLKVFVTSSSFLCNKTQLSMQRQDSVVLVSIADSGKK